MLVLCLTVYGLDHSKLILFCLPEIDKIIWFPSLYDIKHGIMKIVLCSIILLHLLGYLVAYNGDTISVNKKYGSIFIVPCGYNGLEGYLRIAVKILGQVTPTWRDMDHVQTYY